MKAVSQNTKLLGGKGAHLSWMRKEKFNVPPFLVIPTNAWQAGVLDLELSQKLESFLNQNNQLDFAVRSSATVEDGADKSYAGQFKTFLHVKAEGVEGCINNVRASKEAEHVKQYHNAETIEVAVVVQNMISADVSGVVFGVNPVSGNRSETVVSSLYGLGEALVSGKLDGDTFTRKNETWENNIAQKNEKLISVNGELATIGVREELQLKPSLDKGQLEELYALSESLKGKLGTPQDVEFCFKDGELFVLQTRPITTLTTSNRKIWDSSNIIESYPGVTTPLTFSFILRMYQAVYEQLSGLLGVPQFKIDRNTEVYANMLGLLRGRVYYNLINWYRALAMAPGFKLNARFMEKMMGTSETFDLPDGEKESLWQTRKQFVFSIFKLIKAYRRLPRETKRFQHHINEVMTEYEEMNLQKLTAWELLEKIEAYQKVLLKEWKAPLVNDFFAMIYFGLYQKSIEKWYGGKRTHIHNDLLIGSSDIISAEPIQFFHEIDQMIRADAATREFLLQNKADEALQELKRRDDAIWKKIEAYLKRFGDRAVGELKLETETYRQNPALLIQRIQENLRLDARPKENHSKNNIRATAEVELFGALRKPWQKWLMKYLLKNTRRLVSNRENLRYERTRAFGMMRRLFLAMGDKMSVQGLIKEARDIFYLEEKDIFNYLKGIATTTNLKDLVKTRREEFKLYGEEIAPPERIETHGWIYPELGFKQEQAIDGNLKGLACCAGMVRAKVRVIHDPNQAKGLDGEILVTSSTDPGWIALFYGAAGILVERGSLLSHSAIVSREMGIPCIVSIKGLLATLNDGDEVEMDGSTGTIKIVNQA